MSFSREVAQDYPYGTLYGVHIVGGQIISCQRVQRCLMFGVAAAESYGPSAGVLDAHWQALIALCEKIGNGTLDQLVFSEGHPITAKTREGGRRFKGFLKKKQAAKGFDA